jgi:hypothetical protein
MVLNATFEDIYGVSEEEHASESYLDCQVMMAWLRCIMTDEEWKVNFGDLRIEV